jgi:hypothetical protein
MSLLRFTPRWRRERVDAPTTAVGDVADDVAVDMTLQMAMM